MNFPNFTYSPRVVNEIQNEQYYKKTLDIFLEAIHDHPEDRVSALAKLSGPVGDNISPLLSCACLTASEGWVLPSSGRCYRHELSVKTKQSDVHGKRNPACCSQTRGTRATDGLTKRHLDHIRWAWCWCTKYEMVCMRSSAFVVVYCRRTLCPSACVWEGGDSLYPG